MSYLYLACAITAEVVGTTALKSSYSFTRLGPSAITVISYAIAFYMLAQLLKSVPVGLAYALWSGLGMVLVMISAMVVYGERPDWAAVLGVAMIIAGVIVIQLFSNMNAH
nr:multidrug efflux SMR transporter [Phytohalomonas tamaricis]